MKYLHRFPILDPSRTTPDLIAEAYVLLYRVGPAGHTVTRCEWNRRDDELVLLCDANPCAAAGTRCRVGEWAEDDLRLPTWVRDGLIWRAAA